MGVILEPRIIKPTRANVVDAVADGLEQLAVQSKENPTLGPARYYAQLLYSLVGKQHTLPTESKNRFFHINLGPEHTISTTPKNILLYGKFSGDSETRPLTPYVTIHEQKRDAHGRQIRRGAVLFHFTKPLGLPISDIIDAHQRRLLKLVAQAEELTDPSRKAAKMDSARYTAAQRLLLVEHSGEPLPLGDNEEFIKRWLAGDIYRNAPRATQDDNWAEAVRLLSQQTLRLPHN